MEKIQKASEVIQCHSVNIEIAMFIGLASFFFLIFTFSLFSLFLLKSVMINPDDLTGKDWKSKKNDKTE